MADAQVMGKWPVRLGAALVAFVALAVATTAMDRARRSELERVEQRSAVEDTAFLVLPEDYPAAAPFPAVGSFAGSALVPVQREPVDLRDDYMVRQGMDDSGARSVYRYLPESTKKEREPDYVHFYLKLERDRYLKTRAAE